MSNKFFPPLETLTQPHLTTEQAAFYLNRAPQTLRHWACMGDGLIVPHRIGRMLAWPTSEVRRFVS
jgi:hypothetical protein